jgi:hypothetical protein
MPSQSRNMPEQEHSIKVRSHELYVDDTPVAPDRATKPFPVYLRQTPAQPLSPGMKALFWVLGIVVALLFLAAVWRVARHQGPRPPAGGTGVKTAKITGVGSGRVEAAYLSLEESPAVIRYRWTP